MCITLIKTLHKLKIRVMLRGLLCRSAGLVSSSGAGSTASPGCCSPAGSSWTGSATSSYATSGSTSIDKNDAMHEIYAKMQCDACDAILIKGCTDKLMTRHLNYDLNER